MRRVHPVLLVSFVMLAGSAKASAETIFLATLTNAQEVPPAVPTLTSTGAPRPVSFGSAIFTLNDTMTALTFAASIVNIDITGSQTPDSFDNLVAAHIHASPTASPTTTAPVVWGFFGAPFNDVAPTDVVVLPFPTGVGGLITGKWDALEGNNTTLLAQLGNILNERSYINFHTVQFPGGEVRGTLSPVPEPTSLLLVALPAAGLIRHRLRQRKRQS